MPIELRFDNTGAGRIVVACNYCGQEVNEPRESVAVCLLDHTPDWALGADFYVEYAHQECEEQFQERLPTPEDKAVAKKLSMSFAELFDALWREPSASVREEEEHDRES